jgi:Ni,Fe-hydrogenase III large subunit
MDVIVPGGVARDPDDLKALPAAHRRLRDELAPLFDILLDHPSLEDRLFTTGLLRPETAARLGCTGYVGKASGQAFDVRRDNPYAPYDRLAVEIPVFGEGDVAARLQVRMQEILHSLDLLDRLVEDLPDGPVLATFPTPAGNAEGIGFVDGWRGEIVSYVRFTDAGRIARFFPRDPSWFTWPALERIVLGNIVPDFPVCNKSVNGSYSGHDL